jgi:hypothetical protein
VSTGIVRFRSTVAVAMQLRCLSELTLTRYRFGAIGCVTRISLVVSRNAEEDPHSDDYNNLHLSFGPAGFSEYERPHSPVALALAS